MGLSAAATSATTIFADASHTITQSLIGGTGFQFIDAIIGIKWVPTGGTFGAPTVVWSSRIYSLGTMTCSGTLTGLDPETTYDFRIFVSYTRQKTGTQPDGEPFPPQILSYWGSGTVSATTDPAYVDTTTTFTSSSNTTYNSVIAYVRGNNVVPENESLAMTHVQGVTYIKPDGGSWSGSRYLNKIPSSGPFTGDLGSHKWENLESNKLHTIRGRVLRYYSNAATSWNSHHDKNITTYPEPVPSYSFNTLISVPTWDGSTGIDVGGIIQANWTVPAGYTHTRIYIQRKVNDGAWSNLAISPDYTTTDTTKAITFDYKDTNVVQDGVTKYYYRIVGRQYSIHPPTSGDDVSGEYYEVVPLHNPPTGEWFCNPTMSVTSPQGTKVRCTMYEGPWTTTPISGYGSGDSDSGQTEIVSLELYRSTNSNRTTGQRDNQLDDGVKVHTFPYSTSSIYHYDDPTAVLGQEYFYQIKCTFNVRYKGASYGPQVTWGTVGSGKISVAERDVYGSAAAATYGSSNGKYSVSLTGSLTGVEGPYDSVGIKTRWSRVTSGGTFIEWVGRLSDKTGSSFTHTDNQNVSYLIPDGETWYFRMNYEVTAWLDGDPSPTTISAKVASVTAPIPNHSKDSYGEMSFTQLVPGSQARIDISVGSDPDYAPHYDHLVKLYRRKGTGSYTLIKTFDRTLYSSSTTMSFIDNGLEPFETYTYKTENTFRTYYVGQLQTNVSTRTSGYQSGGSYTLGVSNPSGDIDALSTVRIKSKTTSYTGQGAASSVQTRWYRYNSNGTGGESMTNWTNTSFGSYHTLTDILPEGVTKKYRMRAKVTDTSSGIVTYAWSNYSSNFTGVEDISASGVAAITTTLIDNDSVEIDGVTSGITSSAGYASHRIYIQESLNGASGWTDLNSSPTINNGSSGSEQFIANRNRGDTRFYRIKVKVTSVVNGVSDYTYIYSSVKQVNFPPYDPPSGEWYANGVLTASEDSSGITVQFTVPDTPTGSGTYDSLKAVKLIIYRRVKGTSTWSEVQTITNDVDFGAIVTWKDTNLVDFEIYEYYASYRFALIYEGLRYGSTGTGATQEYTGSASNIVEQVRETAPRTVSGTATAVYTDNDAENGYARLEGTVTSISGAGSVTSVVLTWQRFVHPADTYESDEDTANFTSLPASLNTNSALIMPGATWTYKLHYDIVVRFNNKDFNYSGHIDAGEVTGLTPHPHREMITTIDSVESEIQGTQLRVNWSTANRTPIIPGDTFLTHSSHIEWTVKGANSWSSNPPAYTSSYGDNRTWQEFITGVAPFTTYELRVVTTFMSRYGGEDQQDITVGPIFEHETDGAITLDITVPEVTGPDALSRVNLKSVIDNYSLNTADIEYIDVVFEAYKLNVSKGFSTTVRYNSPTLPLVVENIHGPIPEGDNWKFACFATVRNSKYNTSQTVNSQKTGDIVGIEVPPRGVTINYTSINTTKTTLEVTAEVTELTGPGYDNITQMNSSLFYREKDSGDSWTSLKFTTDTVLPVSVSGTTPALVDGTLYEFLVTTEVWGNFLGEDFHYSVIDTPRTQVFNRVDDTGLDNDIRIVNLGYATGGVEIEFKSYGILSDGSPVHEGLEFSDQDITIQRRLKNAGDTWVNLHTMVDAAFKTNLTYVDTTGVVGTDYDYRLYVTTTYTREVGDGIYSTSHLINTSTYQAIEFLVPIADLQVNDYNAVVSNYFTIDHSRTEPSASDRLLLRTEWAALATTDYVEYSPANMDTLPRGQLLQVREIWGRTSGPDEQPSNTAIIYLDTAPQAVNNFTADGTYAGAVLTWADGHANAKVRIRKGGTTLNVALDALDSTYTDGSLAVGVSTQYTINQYFYDAGFYLHGANSYATITRPALPPVPSLPEINSAAFIGRDNSNNPLMHLAPEGTTLAELKSPNPLSTSFFHSATPFIVVTDIKTTTGSLDTATKNLLATRAFMCTIEYAGNTTAASDMTFYKYADSVHGVTRRFNKFTSGVSFGGTAYYNGGNSITLPEGATSAKFYFLNVDLDGGYINPKDGTTDILINKDNFNVGGLKLSQTKLLCGIGNQSNGVIDALNYQDDIIPFNSGRINGHVYSGPSSSCIQVLGSAPTVGWDIKPNKGRIDRVDGSGGRAPWWNAGFGKSRMQYVSTITNDIPKTRANFSFPAPIVVDDFYSYSNYSGTISGINNGANLNISLGDHQLGDFYGFIVTPIGEDELPGGQSEVYSSGKGTLVWSDLSSSIELARYTYSESWTHLDVIDREVIQPQYLKVKYSLMGSLAGNLLSLRISISGRLEGTKVTLNHSVTAAPFRITIIRMR